MGAITYRMATVEDVAALAALRWEMEVERGGELPRTREEYLAAYVAEMREEMARGAHLAWLAEADGAPVASVLLVWWMVPPHVGQVGRRRGFVSSVYTQQEYRRRGIARELMTRLVARAREMGIGRVVLWSSSAGRPLYEELGFIPCRGMELNLD